MKHSHFLILGSLLVGALDPTAAQAYSMQAGDQQLHVQVGGAFNFVRYRVVTRQTPPAFMDIGVAYEYGLTDNLSVVGAFRPGFADTYLNLPLVAGLRYRFPGLQAPLVPFTELDITGALGVPLGPSPNHVNVGLRASGGLEYFLMSNLNLGVEFGLGTGVLLLPAFDLESAAELLVSVGYRF